MRRADARRTRGLTLLELMVVVALLAVMASLAVPEIGRQVARWQLQAVAERLAHDLAEARFQAAQRGQPQYLQLQAGPRWCWSVSERPGCPCDREQACQLQRVVAPSRGGIVIGQDLQIRFEPIATVQPAAGTGVDVLSPHGEQLRVGLTPLGRARVCAVGAPRQGYTAC
jgi:type IV fimbrial biogenesis protein FimT